MIKLLKSLFGLGSSVDFKTILQEGGIIIDVRSTGEYTSGHIAGSLNIPLQSLEKGMSKLDKSKTIITCCASGMRSASAKSILLSNGFSRVYNGGGWSSLKQKIS